MADLPHLLGGSANDWLQVMQDLLDLAARDHAAGRKSIRSGQELRDRFVADCRKGHQHLLTSVYRQYRQEMKWLEREEEAP